MKYNFYLLIALTLFLFSSCVTLYKPNTIQSPLLTEKGEATIGGAIALSGSGLYNLQAAYAVAPNIGLTLNGMYHQRTITSGNSTLEELNMYFGEVGAGYFKKFGADKKTLFQFYGGLGNGLTNNSMNYDSVISPYLKAQYFNAYLQPGLAIVEKNYQIAFDVRANYVRMYNIEAYLYNRFNWWDIDSKFRPDTTISFLNLEPTLTFKAGDERIKGIFQLGATIPTINPESYYIVNTSSIFGFSLIKLSIGICFTFGRKNIIEKKQWCLSAIKLS